MVQPTKYRNICDRSLTAVCQRELHRHRIRIIERSVRGDGDLRTIVKDQITQPKDTASGEQSGQ